MRKNKSKNKLPSRAKYDYSHPVIAVRGDRQFYEELKSWTESTGQSVADILKWAMPKQKAMFKAKVEELAGKRDGLRMTLGKLTVLIRQRKKELEAPIAEERSRLQREFDSWHQREIKRRDQAWSYNEMLLETLRQKVEQEKTDLGQIKLEIASLEARKKAIQAENDRFLKQMKEYIERINTYPWLFCWQCPGAWFNQEFTKFITELASAIENRASREAPSRNEGAKPAPDVHPAVTK